MARQLLWRPARVGPGFREFCRTLTFGLDQTQR
jgi:hypothetical protein